MDQAWTPRDCDTEPAMGQIIDSFAAWVNTLAERARPMHDDADLQRLEEQVRDEGQAMLGRVFEAITQAAVDARQEASRTCPDCGSRRRHQGVRRRRLRSSLGEVAIEGIYWRCPACGCCGHSGEELLPGSLSRLLQQLTALLGASLASFHKAECVAGRVLNVKLDDETIRRHCLAEGWRAARDADEPPRPVENGDTLLGSCDGTMVRTRQTGWPGRSALLYWGLFRNLSTFRELTMNIEELANRMGRLERQMRIYRGLCVALVAVVVVGVLFGAADPRLKDGHFDKLTAREILVQKSEDGPKVEIVVEEDLKFPGSFLTMDAGLSGNDLNKIMLSTRQRYVDEDSGFVSPGESGVMINTYTHEGASRRLNLHTSTDNPIAVTTFHGGDGEGIRTHIEH